jgi:hypothetical protein
MITDDGKTSATCANTRKCPAAAAAAAVKRPSTLKLRIVIVRFVALLLRIRTRDTCREIMARYASDGTHIVLLRMMMMGQSVLLLLEFVDELHALSVGRGGRVSRVATLGLFVERVGGRRGEI